MGKSLWAVIAALLVMGLAASCKLPKLEPEPGRTTPYYQRDYAPISTSVELADGSKMVANGPYLWTYDNAGRQVSEVNLAPDLTTASHGGASQFYVSGAGEIYLNMLQRELQRYGPDGRLLWSQEMTVAFARGLPDGLLVSSSGGVSKLDGDGEVIWTFSAQTDQDSVPVYFRALSVHGETYFQRLWFINAYSTTGELRWKHALEREKEHDVIGACSDRVVVQVAETLVSIDSDGEQEWVADLPAGFNRFGQGVVLDNGLTVIQVETTYPSTRTGLLVLDQRGAQQGLLDNYDTYGVSDLGHGRIGACRNDRQQLKVVVLDSANLTTIWEYRLTGHTEEFRNWDTVRNSYHWQDAPIASDGRVFHQAGGTMRVFDSTGQLVETYQAKAYREALVTPEPHPYR